MFEKEMEMKLSELSKTGKYLVIGESIIAGGAIAVSLTSNRWNTLMTAFWIFTGTMAAMIITGMLTSTKK